MTALEAIRERRKLSRAQLAVAANVSEQQVRLYESATYTGKARHNTARAIAEALGVRVSRIFDEAGRPKGAR